MLTHLRITGIALLDELELELGPGLTVLTGETGAGKSLVVDAVGLLRGGRARSDLVREGMGEARVEAQLELPIDAPQVARLREAGLCDEEADPDGETVTVVVRRVVTAGGAAGRGRVYINGRLATAALLAEVVGGLIEIAGQHEHQGLIDPATHLALVDGFGVPSELRAAARVADESLSALAAQLESASTDERARAEREDFLSFQLSEIDALALAAGEDDTLRAERERLRHAEKFRTACGAGEEILYAREGAVVEELEGIRRELEPLAGLDAEIARVREALGEAQAVCEDAASTLRRCAARLNADPERLAAVEDRLDQMGRLLRKHGPAVEDVLRRRDEMAAELDRLRRTEVVRADLESQLERVRGEAKVTAAALTRARAEACERLAERAMEELRELGMKGARLQVDLAPREAREGDDPARIIDGKRFAATGWDRAELLFSANPGEDLRPLARTASGGELSRLMLALRQALRRGDGVRTHVFDEVDAGVGGAVAEVIGRKLKRVAEAGQVLCVTHLPQIAVYADAQVRVAKEVRGGRTVSVATPLAPEERLLEVARMLGGLKLTDATLAHATEMLEKAGGAMEAGKRRRGARSARATT
jgi:DNA repair protein RecN (Recombination protein N)